MGGLRDGFAKLEGVGPSSLRRSFMHWGTSCGCYRSALAQAVCHLEIATSLTVLSSILPRPRLPLLGWGSLRQAVARMLPDMGFFVGVCGALFLGQASPQDALRPLSSRPRGPPRSVLLSTLHPISRTGYGGQAQLLVAELQRARWHVQLLAWNLRHRGEPPAEDLEALLRRHSMSRSDALAQAGGDPRALLSAIPLVTSRIAPPTGHEVGEGWLEVLRAVDLFAEAAGECSSATTCPFRKPDAILHLHDAWWLGPPPSMVKQAVASKHLPPLVVWLPILFDPLLSDDPDRPDRSGSALELFAGVITMSVWGRGVYEAALASWTRKLSDNANAGLRWLPPLLGHVPHALHPAYSEGPLAFESETRRTLRQLFGLPEKAFVVLLVGRNPPPPSTEANRKSHKAGIRAFARARARISELCQGFEAATEACARFSWAHLHLHCDVEGAVDVRALLAEVGLSLDPGGGASASREHLSQEQLRNLYSASDVLLQLSRAEGFGLPVIEAQACGTPVIVNGATAMAENVVLGRVLLPTPRQSPSGGREDRPGSWTPPDSIAAAEALLGMWAAPPSPTERNSARMILHSNFAPSAVGDRISELLQLVLQAPGANNLTASENALAKVSQRMADTAQQPTPQESQHVSAEPFCSKEFLLAELCWRGSDYGDQSACSRFEERLQDCFTTSWQEPQLAPGVNTTPRNRLIGTRAGGIVKAVSLQEGPRSCVTSCTAWFDQYSYYAALKPQGHPSP